MAGLMKARPLKLKTVNAAHQPIHSSWWWEPGSRTAIIESAAINGLALLPKGRFHPFHLDSFGLGTALLAAAKKGARKALVGIGGSATNDAGFGFSRALGWTFFDRGGKEIVHWPDLFDLERIEPPKKRKVIPSITVAVDVHNPLLGAKGCSRVYGPQKGLLPEDMKLAEAALRRLAKVLQRQHGLGDVKAPGAGAAGGLGFGLAAFCGARLKSGFELVSRHAGLLKRISGADLVITGEGAIDRQTLMGKGVGEIAQLCREAGVPCLALAGFVEDKKKAAGLFLEAGALLDLTTERNALREPATWLENLAAQYAAQSLAG